jgi:queuine/archaeosine tRNA-ribosyltransferase
MTAGRLLTLHNLAFYGRLVADARKAIVEGAYATWSAEVLRTLRADDSEENAE